MTEQRIRGDRVPCRFPKWMREKGVDIYSTCLGFPYARNGNLHNPTPRLAYVAVHEGRILCSIGTLRAAKEVVTIHFQGNQS